MTPVLSRLLLPSALLSPLVGFTAAPAFTPLLTQTHMQRGVSSGESVIIRKQTRVYKRKTDNKFIAEKGPIKVSYPMVSGLRNAVVLRRVQKALLPTSIYDAENGDIASDGWLDEMTYTVNCNRHAVLDVTFTIQGMGAYPDDYEKQITLDLRTGSELRAADLFRDDAIPDLIIKVNQAMRADMQSALRGVEENIDKEASNAVREQLKNKRFGRREINHFSIGARGVTFRYDFGFPHVMKGSEPKGRYFFSYASLSPFIRRGGLLASFVQ